ncbi:MAG: YraN family protein [Acidimicrobiia bacterium]
MSTPRPGRPVRRTTGVRTDPEKLAAAQAAHDDTDADTRQALGQLGEALVADAYQQQGYLLVERNWRHRDGELDLIISRDGTMVFCEVKTRTSHAFGSPADAVTREKRERIRALAAAWLREHRGIAKELRFDVAAVTMREGAETEIEIIEGAF